MITFDDHMAQSAREYLAHVLVVADGNITRAARLAGRNRTDFHRLLVRYGLRQVGGTRRARWAEFGL